MCGPSTPRPTPSATFHWARWKPHGPKGCGGWGRSTAEVIAQASAGAVPSYLARLQAEADPDARAGWDLAAASTGDCHLHSDWSDGGSPLKDMAGAARALGHRWAVLTDHSPRLTIAHGLSPERLESQLEAVAAVNSGMGPDFRLLTGIESDILDAGSLDQDEDPLGRLDIVVASVHSKLRSEPEPMTARLLAAVSNPHVDVLGHCTGRIITGRGRPQSRFEPKPWSPRARGPALRWRSTAAPSGATPRTTCSPRPPPRAAVSPSIPTPTPPNNCTGRARATRARPESAWERTG